MKIQTRILITVLLTILFANIFKDMRYIRSLKRSAESDLQTKILNIGKLINGSMLDPIFNLDYERQDEILDLYFQDDDIKSIHFRESSGEVEKILNKPYLSDKHIIQQKLELTLKGVYLGDIEITYTRENIIKEWNTALRSILLSFFIMLIVVSILLQILLNRVLKPIEELTEVASAITRGDLNRDISVERNDQLGILAKSFVLMRNSINEQISRYKRENLERQQVERELYELNSSLEDLVSARTMELEQVIIDLKETQKQLIESEKMSSLGILVAGVAHEINTPVGVSVTAASHLKDEIEQIEVLYREEKISRKILEEFFATTHEISDIILSNMNKSGNLIRSFKNIAVDQSSEVKRNFQLKEYLDEIALSLRSKFKRTQHKIIIDCSKDIYINSFPGTISQVFTNLIMNSLIHGFEGIDKGIININARVINHILHINYFDDGKGIPVDIIDKVFNPFFTTKRGQGGSGLGLSIVYNLITTSLQGQVSCISEVEKGVEFIINIPID